MSDPSPEPTRRRWSPLLAFLAAAVVVVFAASLVVLYDLTIRRGSDFRQAHLIWTLPGAAGDQVVNALAFSPDGRTLATVGTSYTSYTSEMLGQRNVANTVDLWDVSSRRRIATLRCDATPTFWEAGVRAIAFSPDGRMLAVAGPCAGGENDRNQGWAVQLWDTTAHRVVATLSNPHSTPESFSSYYSLRFSPDGRILAAGGGAMQGTVNLWDVGSREFTAELTVGSVGTEIYSVAFSPDGRTLASAAHGDATSPDNSVQLWDVGSSRRLGTLPNQEPRAVEFSPDGQVLAVAGRDDSVQLWDAHSRRLLTTLTTQRPAKLTPLTAEMFSPDGRILAASDYAGTVTLWDLASHQVVNTLSCDCPAGDLGFLTMAFSPDGEMLAAGGVDAVVKVWSRR